MLLKSTAVEQSSHLVSISFLIYSSLYYFTQAHCLLAPLLSRWLTFLLVYKCVRLPTFTTCRKNKISQLSIFCQLHLCLNFQSASGKGAARVDTVASACRLSLLFGEDKVVGSRGLEEAWKDLQAKLASGYPALFYGQIPYLLVYAAAGVNIQFGRLLPLGQVFYHDCISCVGV